VACGQLAFVEAVTCPPCYSLKKLVKTQTNGAGGVAQW
jgi:hypothetical protein